MIVFADTSFLCALYREQENSSDADTFVRKHRAMIGVSSLVLWEFRQSSRFQVYRYSKDRTQGFSKAEADRMLNVLETNLRSGIFELFSPDWPDVHKFAEGLSARHTISGGHRSMDILHLATALHLKAGKFLTFDRNQTALARAAGLTVPLKSDRSSSNSLASFGSLA